jgi:hypothetical protein
MTVFPNPVHFSVFPRLKIELKGSHFDTTEAIEAESHTELNTVAEHFQDAFEKRQERWERYISTERGLFRGACGQYAQS